jgi:hypothetical protein
MMSSDLMPRLSLCTSQRISINRITNTISTLYITALDSLNNRVVIRIYLNTLEKYKTGFIFGSILLQSGSLFGRPVIKQWSVHSERACLSRLRAFPFWHPIDFLADRIRRHSVVPMATQDSRSILFTNTNPQQGFRLLELTPELEALLSSKDAPT